MEAREKEIKEVPLDPEDPEVKVLIGTSIPEDIEPRIIDFLKSRITTFAWKHEDMTGISKDIITHKLGIDKSFRPIHQKRRKFAPERNIIIQEEVERLLKEGADGQGLYNMDEDKFDITDLGMCTRYFDLWNLDIVFPFLKNRKMDIPMDVLNLMEVCALKKLMNLFERYGANHVESK